MFALTCLPLADFLVLTGPVFFCPWINVWRDNLPPMQMGTSISLGSHSENLEWGLEENDIWAVSLKASPQYIKSSKWSLLTWSCYQPPPPPPKQLGLKFICWLPPCVCVGRGCWLFNSPNPGNSAHIYVYRHVHTHTCAGIYLFNAMCKTVKAS